MMNQKHLTKFAILIMIFMGIIFFTENSSALTCQESASNGYTNFHGANCDSCNPISQCALTTKGGKCPSSVSSSQCESGARPNNCFVQGNGLYDCQTYLNSRCRRTFICTGSSYWTSNYQCSGANRQRKAQNLSCGTIYEDCYDPNWYTISTCSNGCNTATDNCCTSTCTLNSKRCSGNNVQTCTSVNGCKVWTNTKTCTSPQVCSSTTNDCSSSCTTPINGGWSDWQNVGSCGEYQTAKQKQIKTCDNPVPSCGGSSCTGSSEQFLDCSDTSCTSNCQTPNTKQCSGNTVQTCTTNADGCSYWTNSQTCVSPETCLGGSCGSQTCTSFTYSPWSLCSSTGTKTRTIDQGFPAGCTGGTPDLQDACTQNCSDILETSCKLNLPNEMNLSKAYLQPLGADTKCGKTEQSGGESIYYDCICSWKNNKCIGEWNTSIGTCSWDETNIQDTCSSENGKLTINYTATTTPPIVTIPECTSKTIDYPCLASAKLPFFDKFTFLLSIIGIALIYIFKK
jgi:hypothetical protein